MTKAKVLSRYLVGAMMFCLSVLPSLGTPIKERDWQEGKLTDIISEPYTRGYIANGTGGVVQLELITYVIDAGQYIYRASHTHHRRDKALPVTVNAKIKFAIEKSKVYILDEENKEHELKFVKKTLKDTASEK